MPSLDQIRAAIAAKITAADAGARVHDYERYSNDIGALAQLYVDNAGKLRGWNIRRLATRETSPAIGRYVVTHRWRITGYRGFDDASGSEKLHDAAVEAVRDAIRADSTLGGLVEGCVADVNSGLVGVQVEDSGPVMFGGVLAHAVRLGLSTLHFQ